MHIAGMRERNTAGGGALDAITAFRLVLFKQNISSLELNICFHNACRLFFCLSVNDRITF